MPNTTRSKTPNRTYLFNDGGHLPAGIREALTRGVPVDGRGSPRPPNIAIVSTLIERADAYAAIGDGRFRIGPYHLAQVHGSPNWYRFWYCQDRGYDRKVTLKTSNLDEAKVLLALHYCAENPRVFQEEGDPKIALCVETFLLDPKNFKTWNGTFGSVLRAIEELFPNITVGSFTPGCQKDLIRRLRAGFKRGPMKPNSIASSMSFLRRALNAATEPDDDGSRLCRIAPMPILATAKGIAELLNVPAPPPRNWHPTYEQFAQVILRFLFDQDFAMAEPVRRWFVLSVAFGCRVGCALEATAEQLDRQFMYYKLNPDGRIQIENKYRPNLPVPPSLLAEIDCWTDEQYIDLSYNHLQQSFLKVRAELGLGEGFVPSCIRDFMAWALRHAHLDFGIPRVPADEVELWLGHQRPGNNKHYGTYEPEYLLLARNAVECVLHELDSLCGGILLANGRKAGTLPSGPVVIDPSVNGGRRRRSQVSVKSEVHPIVLQDEKYLATHRSGVAGDIGCEGGMIEPAGGSRGKSGHSGVLGTAFCQVPAKAIPKPTKAAEPIPAPPKVGWAATRLVQFLAALDDTAEVQVGDFVEAVQAERIPIAAARSAIAALKAAGIIAVEDGQMRVIQQDRWLDGHRKYLSSFANFPGYNGPALAPYPNCLASLEWNFAQTGANLATRPPSA